MRKATDICAWNTGGDFERNHATVRATRRRSLVVRNSRLRLAGVFLGKPVFGRRI